MRTDDVNFGLWRHLATANTSGLSPKCFKPQMVETLRGNRYIRLRSVCAKTDVSENSLSKFEKLSQNITPLYSFNNHKSKLIIFKI